MSVNHFIVKAKASLLLLIKKYFVINIHLTLHGLNYGEKREFVVSAGLNNEERGDGASVLV